MSRPPSCWSCESTKIMVRFRMKKFLLLTLFNGWAVAQPTISGCPAFPANNIWNVAVDHLPVHSQSAQYVATVGAGAGLRLDDTIPINIAKAPPKTDIAAITTPESDPNPYGIPPNPAIETGVDGHLVVVDVSACILYELYAAKVSNGVWSAGSAAKWDLNSNALRPPVWTSADAAGLPIMPGVLRYSEVAAGSINHALRLSSPKTLYATPMWPARHCAAPPTNTDPSIPMMGQRFRLKAGFDISGFSPRVQIVLKALKRYGAMIADNGLPWSMQHDQDSRWEADDLLVLHQITGANMEAVDVSGLMSDSNSAIAGPAGGMVVVTDALGRPNAVKLGAGLAVINGTLVVVPR